jgi:hypothetical protein
MLSFSCGRVHWTKYNIITLFTFYGVALDGFFVHKIIFFGFASCCAIASLIGQSPGRNRSTRLLLQERPENVGKSSEQQKWCFIGSRAQNKR